MRVFFGVLPSLTFLFQVNSTNHFFLANPIVLFQLSIWSIHLLISLTISGHFKNRKFGCSCSCLKMDRRGSLVSDRLQIRPEDILSYGYEEELPGSDQIESPSSAEGLTLSSPKREWSLLKYSSKLIPKSFKKFGDTLRSLSQSDDEGMKSPRIMSPVPGGSGFGNTGHSDLDVEVGTDEDRDDDDLDSVVVIEKERNRKKKIMHVGFASYSQSYSHDETGERKEGMQKKLRLPQRAKSHPPPKKSTLEKKNSSGELKRSCLKTRVGFSQIPDIKITRVSQSSVETLSTGTGGGNSPPTSRRPSRFHSSEHGKCKRCLKFVEDLKRIFKGVTVRREKYQLLTSIPPQFIQEGDVLAREFGCSEALAYSALALRATMGAYSSPQPQFVQHIPEYIKTTIMQFFLEVENSGNMKSRDDPFFYGEFFGGVKRKAMFISLSELYHEYLQIHPEHRKSMNISRFAYFIPRNVVWSKPFRGNSYNSCMIHENLQLMLQACTTYYSEGISKVLSAVVCSQNNIHCMLGFCEICPMPGSLNMLSFDCEWDEDLDYHVWMKDVQLEMEKDEMACAPMKLGHIIEPAPAFIGRLNRLILGEFLNHHFIYMMQKEYLQHMNSYLCMKTGVALVKMDFSEPYQALSKIGPMKSNLVDFDPKNHIAVHPFCIKFFDSDKGKIETRFVVVISNLLREDASSSYIFRAEMVKWMRHTLPEIKKIVYFSDDNPKHFRNSETILNLLYHEEDFKLKADHEFTAEGHENQEVETVVTQIKRRARLASLSGEVEISNAEELFQFCRSEMARYDLQFSYVNGNVGRIRNLEGKLAIRYRVNDGIVPGLRMFHSVRPEFSRNGPVDIIHLRRYSLSKHEKKLKISLSTSGHCHAELYGHEVVQYQPELEMRGGISLNPEKFSQRNLVNLNLEGTLFRGRIENHDRIAWGELKVSLIGKMERKMRKKRKGEKDCFMTWKTERTVWVSTLDVVSVAEVICEEECSMDLKGYLRRLSTVSMGRKEVSEVQKERKLKRRSSSLSPSRIITSLDLMKKH